MDLDKMLELAGIKSSGKQLNENVAGAVAGAVVGKAIDSMSEEDSDANIENRDKIRDFEQDVDYDEDMATEGECPSPYNDGHGQYGEKCLVGDDVEASMAEPVVVAEPVAAEPEVADPFISGAPEADGSPEVVVIDLGEDEFDGEADDDMEGDDTDVHLDFEYGETDPEVDSMVANINDIDDRYMDHTTDPSTMIAKIDAMQQGGMSSANANYDIEVLSTLPTDRLTKIYNKVMGNGMSESEDDFSDEDLPALLKPQAGRAMADESLAGGLDEADVDAISIDDEEPEVSQDAMVDIEPDAGMDMDMEAEPSVASNPAEMMDTSGMVAKIIAMQDAGMSSATAEYGVDSLINMSPDALLRIYKKVMGEGLEEEDQNWGGEDGYQTRPSDTEGHLRGTSPYNGGEGFPTGQADNAVKHIGNTGGEFKDNPLRNADPVDVEESIDLSESFEDIHAKLSESFDQFCEDYEKMVEDELNEIGNMSFSTRPSMRSRGYGLRNAKFGDAKKKKAAAMKQADDAIGDLERRAQAAPEKDREMQEGDVDENRFTNMRKADEFEKERQARHSQRRQQRDGSAERAMEPKPKFNGRNKK